MKYIIFFSVLLVFCFTFSVCKKDDPGCPPDLPCATQTGENTFGCYIDGEPWVAGIASYVWDPTLHKIEANYDEPSYGKQYFNGFQLTATRIDSISYDFWKFSCSPILSELELKHDHLASLRFEARLTSPLSDFYHLDTMFPYKIQITHLDTSKNIASGRFDLTMVSSSKTDTIKITEGRFDIRYNPE